MVTVVREGSVWEGLVVSGVVVGREDYREGICETREEKGRWPSWVELVLVSIVDVGLNI